MKIIATNKKANFDYFINEKFEAGLVLTGSEVKSLRINTGSIKESFVVEKEGENTIKASLTRVEDFGNFKLLTANMDNFVIKSKVDRELPISIGDINLYIPPEKCCVYENEKLI